MDVETPCIEGYGNDHDAEELDRDGESVYWQCMRSGCDAKGFEAIEDWEGEAVDLNDED